jgi:hypothetical protein
MIVGCYPPRSETILTTTQLTDEELLREVYASHADNAVMQDLARRFDDTLDQMAELKAAKED